jgi:hypothetical protein
MLTAGANALALVRFGGARVIHSGGRDGFALLLIGLVVIGVLIWALSGPGRGEPANS